MFDDISSEVVAAVAESRDFISSEEEDDEEEESDEDGVGFTREPPPSKADKSRKDEFVVDDVSSLRSYDIFNINGYVT